MNRSAVRAVLWDFGGVILSSPFDAFNDYERANGLPVDFIRKVNAAEPDHNAWARIERQEITAAEFDVEFASESAGLGHAVSGSDVLSLLRGEIRPEMVSALDRVGAAGYITACLTNNVLSGSKRPDVDVVMARFDHVIESSKVGCRKPEQAFYELACDRAGVTPHECVFLDDLGVNLKPARAMGMITIKVTDPGDALGELESVLGVPLR